MVHSRVREIFNDCLDLDPSAREARIAEACAGDQEMAERIRRLLTAHDRGGIEPGAIPADHVAAFEDPAEIGPYQIKERIGEGGMGIVYAAEQMRPIKRRVALKIIKVGMDSKDVIARFESERQALALMNHPNIAGILDAGATETGRPYFVMELVTGVSIIQYCDSRQLSIEQRLLLVTDVGRAVEHAHKRGVVHRDIKPTNILVAEEDGRMIPKIIDFGIAKATDQRLTDLSIHTRVGHVIGTPEYMSPEQTTASPGVIDARTDVYSLGVVLYELLTGVRPFDFGDSEVPFDEILRIIREEEPPPPSARVAKLGDLSTRSASNRSTTPSALVRTLRGSLDRITMMALAKNRRDRYPSAASLVADIQRYTTGASVSARPARRSRFSRWSPRQIITAALVVGISIATGIVLTYTTKPGASTSAGDAPRVLVLPFQFLGNSNDAYIAEGISEEISHRLNDLSNLSVLGRQTALFAAARAMSAQQIADELDADFILEGTVRVQRVSGGPAEMRVRAALTNARSESQVWTEAYDVPMDNVFSVQANVASRVVQAVGIQLPAVDSQSIQSQPTHDPQAYQYFLRANDFARRGELESDMRTALELYYEAGRLDPTFAPAWAAVSVTRSRLAWRGYDGSTINLRLAKEAGERALGLDDGNADGHFALGYYNYYGFRDYAAALMHFAEADRRRPNDPRILYALGLVHRRLGTWDSAIASLRSALRLDPKDPQIAISLGETQLALGNYSEAERLFDDAIAIAPDRPGVFLFKAWLYLAWKDSTSQAIDALQQGWDAVGGGRLFGLFGRYLSDTDWWLSRVLARDPRYQEMFDALDPAALGIDSAAYYLHAAEYHDALGHRSRSRAYYDSTRSVLEGRLPPGRGGRPADVDRMSYSDRSDLGNTLMWLGVAYTGLGIRDSAINIASRGASVFTSEADALHGSEGLLHLGLVYGLLGDSVQATNTLVRALGQPSSFRAGMLRHDDRLRTLLDDPRLRQLLPGR